VKDEEFEPFDNSTKTTRSNSGEIEAQDSTSSNEPEIE
jgi:hypothetical protein